MAGLRRNFTKQLQLHFFSVKKVLQNCYKIFPKPASAEALSRTKVVTCCHINTLILYHGKVVEWYHFNALKY